MIEGIVDVTGTYEDGEPSVTDIPLEAPRLPPS